MSSIKDKPLVSIIIPVYNVEKYIKKCAMSLIRQTYDNCEFVFVNDGTKDKSIKILESINDNRIKIINQENKGVSAARNKGIETSNGELITFVDADDFVANDYVEYLYNLITNNDADFAYTINLFQSKNELQVVKDNIKIVDGNESTGILLSPDVVVASCNKIYKKDIIVNNNIKFRTDLYYGEGLNFIIRMSLASKRIAIGERKILYYRKNNMSSATTKYNAKKYHNGLKSLEIVKKLINLEDDYVNSMYTIHITTFYLGAISQMIGNKKKGEYLSDYKEWKKEIKNNLWFILRNKYISSYRKCMIFVGNYFPHLIALMDKIRRKKIIKNSVD